MSESPPLPFIAEVLEGRVAATAQVMATPHHELLSAAPPSATLVVGRLALLRALTDWAEGRVSAEQIRAWASFLRRGYCAGGKSPVKPLDFHYDPSRRSVARVRLTEAS
jgi:hypothetical protein